MRYYLDTEFDEEKMELISVGVVAQDGREFYAVLAEYDWSRSSEWLVSNVRPHVFANRSGLSHLPRRRVAEEFILFMGEDPEPRFWAYFAHYDWVLFRRLFGTSPEEMHPGIPLICYDLKQLAVSCGVAGSLKKIVAPFQPEHHALQDARWAKHVHEQLIMQYEREV